MKKIVLNSASVLLLLVFIAGIFGCSWVKIPSLPSLKQAKTTEVPPAADSNIINIEESSTSFKPGLIRVDKPGSYALQVKNLTGSEQGMTLKDPEGKVIYSLRTGPKSTSISNIEFPIPGSYELTGDKLFRLYPAKKGRIVVGPVK